MDTVVLPAGRVLYATLASIATSTRKAVNETLESVEPFQIIVFTLLLSVILRVVASLARNLWREIEDHGLEGARVRLTFRILRSIPGVAGYIEKEKTKMLSKIQGPSKEKKEKFRTELPQMGLGEGIYEEIKATHLGDKWWKGKCSGTVYMGGPNFNQHSELVTHAYLLFSHTNPLHSDVFPSVVKFESEVVAMTANLLGGNSKNGGGSVCGNMTNGGSESILMAVKATRDYMRATKNITKPELVVAESAHSAYDKAAQYFGIRLRRVAVGTDYRADVKAMRKCINSNTIMIVASAPGFPHGVIDPIESLGALALRKGICLHVDLCLGGFVLPFARKLGYPIPPFGFEVRGVTSISADTHKYGLGPKGSSVVLFRNHEIRRHQFVAVTEWSGGLYVSPTVSGSRSGGLIAAAWASLVSVGENGFVEMTRSIMETTKQIVDGIKKIDGLFLVGEPDMTIVAFGSHEFDIYQVNDAMTEKGWSLNALQRPASIHICVTLQHINMVESFLHDLANSVRLVRDSGYVATDGMAPVYGAAAKMPHRGTVEDLLLAYMDSM